MLASLTILSTSRQRNFLESDETQAVMPRTCSTSLSALGIITNSLCALYHVAADCLEVKMTSMCNDGDEVESSVNYERIISSLRDDSFGLHSDC